MHQFVDKGEVVEIVDSLLGHCSLEYLCPNLLIVPLDVVELSRQIKECPLVKANFVLPELQDNTLEV